VEHVSKRTHEHRNIVIPCPDLLYSTVACDFATNPATVLLFNAPANVYASLGVYDESARCVGIVSHSNEALRLVVVGPEVTASDVSIKSALHLGNDLDDDNKDDIQEYKVQRMPTSKGLLLHRLLMISPSDCMEMEALQTTAITCTAQELPVESLHLLLNPSRSRMWSLVKRVSGYVYAPVSMPCLCIMLALAVAVVSARVEAVTSVDWWHIMYPVLVVLGGGYLSGAIIAAVTLKLLKIPSVVVHTNLLKLERIGNWLFNALDTDGDCGSSGSSSDSGGVTVVSGSGNGNAARSVTNPFAHLIFFLHGALGLLPSEVYYGASSSAFMSVETSLSSTSLSSSLSSTSAASEKLLSDVSSPFSQMVELKYGESYVIDVPTLDLKCAW
jgi:hypothetical protein